MVRFSEHRPVQTHRAFLLIAFNNGKRKNPTDHCLRLPFSNDRITVFRCYMEDEKDFPPCARCGGHAVVRFGFLRLAGEEPQPRFYCKGCKKPFARSLDPDVLRLRPLRRLGPEVLKGIAMYAHGLPLRDVEIQARVGTETVKANLLKLEHDGFWEDLEDCILHSFPMVSKTSMDGLRRTVRESAQQKSAFQRRSARLRRELAKKSQTERDDFYREIDEIDGVEEPVKS
jgi:hypothetical protein